MLEQFKELIKPSIFDEVIEKQNFGSEEYKSSDSLWQSLESFEESLEIPLLSGKIIHEGILLNQDNADYVQELTVELYEDRLVAYRTPEKKQLFGIIGLKNGVRFEYSDLESQDEEEISFLFFQKKKRFAVLFCESVSQFEKWLKFIKPIGIQSNFQEYYTFEKIIGKGSFAKVILCTRNSDKKQFAVKVFDKQSIRKSKDPQLQIRGLQNELNIMHEIDHPNVIKMYEIYEGEKHFYVVLELLRGGELFKYICDDENFSEQTILELMRNLLQALEYLHAKKIMHRDLKPENIILKNKNGKMSEIVLADFGLSEHIEKKKFLFKRCGTPGYVAPEILQDEPYDTQADVFSAGIIMYILLTGMSTFYGDSYMEILNKNKKCIINFDFQALGCKISKNAEDLIKLMLKRNPKERVTISQALQHPWFKEKSISQESKIHHEAMQKLLKQQFFICNHQFFIKRYNLVKTTKPQNLTDSQNVISNSPLITGQTSGLLSQSNSQKNSPTFCGSPKQIISPYQQQEKKSKFAGMCKNIEQMNQQQSNVAALKEKIQNPSSQHRSLKAVQQQQKQSKK